MVADARDSRAPLGLDSLTRAVDCLTSGLDCRVYGHTIQGLALQQRPRRVRVLTSE